ncbi:MAG: hypothetical protein NT085_00905 [candidate division SR1 bacterium]|nr:hypothetical protein [candidate division SR1 bacterium]
MKKLLNLILVSVLVFLITSCGNTDVKTEQNSKNKIDSLKGKDSLTSVKKTAPTNVLYGLYFPQETTVNIGSETLDYKVWTIVLIDTDYDSIPETPFIIKTKVYQELNQKCTANSLIALIVGMKGPIIVKDSKGQPVPINLADEKTGQKPVVSNIMEYLPKPKHTLSNVLIEKKR